MVNRTWPLLRYGRLYCRRPKPQEWWSQGRDSKWRSTHISRVRNSLQEPQGLFIAYPHQRWNKRPIESTRSHNNLGIPSINMVSHTVYCTPCPRARVDRARIGDGRIGWSQLLHFCGLDEQTIGCQTANQDIFCNKKDWTVDTNENREHRGFSRGTCRGMCPNHIALSGIDWGSLLALCHICHSRRLESTQGIGQRSLPSLPLCSGILFLYV